MAKYKKRADGRFFTLVSTGHYDEDGKPERIPVYAFSSKQLEEKVAAIKYELNKGIYANDYGLSFKNYAEKWLVTYKQDNVTAATLRNYTNIIDNHIEKIADIQLKDLTKSDIQMQLNNLVSKPEAQRLAKITINQILECAIDDGLIYKNVCRGIKLKVNKAPEKRALTEAEKKAIKKCDFDEKEKLFVDLLFCTGMRRGELLALTKNDFDLSHGCETVTVIKSLSWIGGTELKVPKTSSSNRKITIPDWIIPELRDYLNNCKNLYIFSAANGNLFSESSYRRFWKRIFNKINEQLGGSSDVYKNKKIISKGIKATDLTPHIFRHNYATSLYYAGVDVKEAQYLLGHSSIKVTLEIYTHLKGNEISKKKINAINY